MILYAISDRSLAPGKDLIHQASSLIRAGVDWLQIREKDLPDRTLFLVLKALVPEARRFGTVLLVNGRPDLAAASGASGVHLPSLGLPTAEVRRAFPPPFTIVRSCHCEEDLARAEAEGADAAVFGPVYPTPSKTPFGPPLGVDRLREACSFVRMPVLALGGITRERLGEVGDAGAAGIAAIRLFCAMANPISELPALRGPLAGGRQ
jgi:thiamine-phosphate pyrophosphorylase